jgi:hypothetical protein
MRCSRGRTEEPDEGCAVIKGSPIFCVPFSGGRSSVGSSLGLLTIDIVEHFKVDWKSGNDSLEDPFLPMCSWSAHL